MQRTHCDRTAPSTFSTALLVVVIITASIDSSRLHLLLVPASFLLASYGVGVLFEQAMRRWVPPLPAHLPWLRLTTRLGAGISITGLITTILGQWGYYQTSGLFMLLALAWSLFSLAKSPPSLRLFRPSIASLVGGMGIGVVWSIAWLWATIPPTFYDELAYHLPIAQHTLRTGTIPATPWLFFTYMPHLSDLFLGWGLALAGDLGARAMHVTFWIAIWIAGWALIEGLTAPATSPWIGYALAGAYASSAMFLFLGTLPFAETSLTFAVLASAALLIGSAGQAAWVPAGLLWGFTLSVKLSGISWVIAIALASLVVGWPMASVLRAGLVALAIAAPWWGRAWWLTGNPIYPMGYRWIGSRYWDEASQSRLQGDLPAYLDSLDMRAILRLPVDMVVAPEYFGSASDCGWLAVVAIGLVLSLPLWALSADVSRDTRRRCFAAGVFTVIAGTSWVMTSTTTRFFAPALMGSVCIFVAMLLRLPAAGLATVLVALSASGAQGITHFLSAHTHVFASEKVAIGQESGSTFAQRTLDHYEAARYVKTYLPLDANLLFIGESRPFYFDRTALAPYPFHQHPLAGWIQEAQSPEQLRDRIRREGFTHVILNTREFKRLRERYGILTFNGPQSSLHDQLLKQLPQTMVTLFSKNSVYVLEVPSTP